MNQRTSELSEIEKVMVVKTGLGIYARSIQTMYTMPPPNGIFYLLFINAYSLCPYAENTHLRHPVTRIHLTKQPGYTHSPSSSCPWTSTTSSPHPPRTQN